MSDPGQRAPTPGASGHPEPGSAHDDSKTETIAEGPDVPRIDGVPGAHGDVATVGGPVTEASVEGDAVEVADEMDS